MRIVVKNLVPGNNYQLQFRSKSDDDVSEWSRSFGVTISTPASKPLAPTGVTLTSVGDSFKAKWNAVTESDDGSAATDLSGYIVQFRNTVTNQIATLETTGTDYELTFNLNTAFFTPIAGTVGVKVAARNLNGNQSDWSTEAIAQNPPPGPVRNLVAESAVDSIIVRWEPPLNLEDDFKEYRVYVGSSTGFTPTDSNLVWRGIGTTATYSTLSQIDHYFKVVAVDKFNGTSTVVTSGAVRPRSAATVDVDAPATPTNLNGSIVGQRLTVTWTAPANPDNDLAGYQIGYRPAGATGWSYATASHEDTSVVIEPVNRYVNYEVKIQAHDFSFNYSAWSANKTINGEANTAPSVPTGLAVKGAITSAMVVWNANTESDLAGYEVQWRASSAPVDSDPVFPTTGRTISFSENVTQNVRYYARVRAVDTQGLKSAWSAAASDSVGFVDIPEVELSDGVAPASSPVATLRAGVGSIFAQWPAVTNNDAVTYEIHIGTTTGFTPAAGTKIGETPSTFATIQKLPDGSALAYNTNYYVRIIAKDVDGAATAGAASNAAAIDYVPTQVDITNLNSKVDQAIKSNVIEYAVNASETTAPTTGWSTDTPARSAGQYIWFRTVITYGNNTSTISNPALLTGNAGAPGATGKGISSTTVNYAKNTSGTTAPTTGWSTTIPATTTGEFLWTRTVITYTDSTTSSPAYSVSAHGAAGSPGTAGRGISGTVVNYAVSSSGTTEPTTGWQATVPTTTAGQYLWTRTVTTYTDSTTTTAYSVARHGATGSQGVSVSSITPFYITVTKGAAAPAQPSGTADPAGWSKTEPAFVVNTELYRTERILYSNSTAAWTPVTKVASYDAAADARAIAITADNRVRKGDGPPPAGSGANAPVGALWWEYGPATSPGTGTVLKQTWEWNGSVWQTRGIDRTLLPAVDIGTGTFGDLSGARLVANSVKALQIDTDDLTANTAFINSLKVNSANIIGTLTIGQVDTLQTALNDKASTSAVNTAVSDAISTAAGDATTKANAAQTNAINAANAAIQKATNLIDNPTRTGAVGRWTSSQPASETLTIENVTYNGTTAKALRSTSSGATNQLYSSTAVGDHFDVDPTKAYMVTVDIWDEKVAPSGTQFYFGVTMFEANGTTGNTGVIPVPRSTGIAGAQSNNHYFTSYSAAQASAYVGQWRRYTAYLMPYGTDPALMKNLGSTTVTSNAIMLPNAVKGRIRILNYSNSAAAPRYVDILNPTVVEMDPQAVLSALKADTLTSAWTATGTTKINGGVIETDTIGAGSIKTAELAADSAFVTALRVTTANITDLTFDRIQGGQGIINDVTVKSTLTLGDATVDGVIQSHGFSGTTAGFKLSKSGVTINQGTVEARTLKIQSGQNLMRPEYSDFEFPDSFYNNTTLTPTNFTTTAVQGGRFNKQALALRATATGASSCYFGVTNTDYNIPVESGKVYIISGWVKGGPVTSAVQFRIKWSTGTEATLTTSPTSIAANAAWTRFTAVTAAAPSTATGAILSVHCSTSAVNSGFDIDGIQVEEKIGAINTPSAWNSPGTTTIDGAMIRTGEIRSNTLVPVPGAGNQPAWVLNTAGNMQINSGVVRGNLVVGQAGTETGSIIQSYNYIAGSQGFLLRGHDGFAEFQNILINLNASAGKIIAGNPAGARAELDQSGLKVYGSASTVIMDATGGSVNLTGTLRTGTATSGVHVEPDTSFLGNGIIRWRGGGETVATDAAFIALEARSGGALSSLTINGLRPTNTSTSHAPIIRLETDKTDGKTFIYMDAEDFSTMFGTIDMTTDSGYHEGLINIESMSPSGSAASPNITIRGRYIKLTGSTASGSESKMITLDTTDVEIKKTGVGATLWFGTYQNTNWSPWITSLKESGNLDIGAPAHVYLKAGVTGPTASANSYIRVLDDNRFQAPGVYATTTTNGTNINVSSAGIISRSTSLTEYKLAIEDADVPNVLELRPVTWIDRANAERLAEWFENGGDPDDELYSFIDPLDRQIGLLAEEVESLGIPGLATYDGDGKLNGVAYDRVAVALIPEMKKMRDRMERLEALLEEKGL